ncbi:hypothetical protein MNR01_14015 [Lysobacter sp. S4-A87]|uniref:hypothetical protein n=1 Tax=Lysobacter sp. S4-A87 TaxID=2925843 RepID=UPI001F532ACE|nr:hypothetical protein [Lysobacter sp. S4-A87]UNK48845.1 hypothetical protein MNR01_14015 [Lysobacter sp. S4-A87]
MNIRKPLFAVALTALAGSALAAQPATTPAAPAKTSVSKHKHATKAETRNANQSKPGEAKK